MRRLSLGTRVALASAAAIVMAVALLGIGVQLELSRQRHASLDAGLRKRAADIARLNASAPAVLSQPGALDTALSPPALDIEVLDSRGRVVARTTSLGARLFSVTDIARPVIDTGQPSFTTIGAGDGQLRVFAAPLADIGGGQAAGGAVVVAASTQDVTETLQHVRTALTVGAIVAALLGALAALALSRRALRPLRTLTAGTELVGSTGDPTRRLVAADAA